MKTWFAFLLILVISCSGPVPHGVMAPEAMKKTMYEMIQVDEYLNNFAVKDSLINLKTRRSMMYEQVFDLNKTTRKDFYASYHYYQQHPDLHKILFDSLQSMSTKLIVK